MEDLSGKIKGITYSDKATDFYILKVSNSDGGKDIVVRGTFYGVTLSIGHKVKFSGGWIDHDKYGRQFDAKVCELQKESGRSGVINYLVAHVPSIGPITASKLYLEFGDQLLDVLNKTPEKILEVPFLTKTQSQSILDEWRHSSAARTVTILLSDLGLHPAQIKAVYTKWGMATREILKDDPYRLAECDGVGFTTADNAARRLGWDADSPKRVRAVLLAVVNDMCHTEGHMYVTASEVQNHSKKFFKRNNIDHFASGPFLSDINFFSGLKSLLHEGAIVSDNDRLYLKQYWYDESQAAEFVSQMVANECRDFGDLEATLNEFELDHKLTLAAEQREAYMLLDTSNVIVISGYPGTGKTLLTSAFVHLFEKLNLHYALLSPTGIAAKRITQVTGKPAMTIHRALGYKGDSWEFHQYNKYAVDAVILDEASMVDGKTFQVLVSSLLPSTTLIIIGDSAQLPSVGAGYVLNNLLRSSVPHVYLKRIYRQSRQSDIITVAHQILAGEPIDLSFKKESEFVFLQFDKESVVEEICKMTSKLKEKDCDFQVIAPMYDGPLGVDSLNRELRRVLNSDFEKGDARHIKQGQHEWYEGDRVMVTKNNYDKMVYNGDVGKILKINLSDDEVDIKIFDWFDQNSPSAKYIDKVFTYKVDEVKKNFRVAYACSCHKSQGNAFDYVILPMTTDYRIMLYRNLIYTAMTRARRKVFLFGDPSAFQLAVENNRDISRNSNLAALVDGYLASLSASNSVVAEAS
jgi:exodeoxyribonuclease V alpha subunit